jgi:hypothetical protein
MIPPVLAENFLQKLAHTPALVACGVAVFLLLLAVVRVIFFSRRHHRHRRRHHWSQRHASPESEAAAPTTAPNERRGRRRRRGPALNPTLAQTRGLPPARDGASQPPPS